MKPLLRSRARLGKYYWSTVLSLNEREGGTHCQIYWRIFIFCAFIFFPASDCDTLLHNLIPSLGVLSLNLPSVNRSIRPSNSTLTWGWLLEPKSPELFLSVLSWHMPRVKGHSHIFTVRSVKPWDVQRRLGSAIAFFPWNNLHSHESHCKASYYYTTVALVILKSRR